MQKSDPMPATLYTCPMQSDNYVTNAPGKCPICEMNLVPTTTVPFGKAMEEKWHKEHEHQH